MLLSTPKHLATVASAYQSQMCTYAWLCLRSYPECSTDRTRLVFTRATIKGLHQIDHLQEWKPENMKEMDEEMMKALRLVIP